jgi:regulation of enolase protein 1 (concanavalin A-like superfamily)
VNLEKHPKTGIVLGYSKELQCGMLVYGREEHFFKTEIEFNKGDKISFFINKHFTFRVENVRLIEE